MGKLTWIVTGDRGGVLGITSSRRKAEQKCRNYIARRMQVNGYSLSRIDRHEFTMYTKYESVEFMIEARARGYTMGEFDDD